MAGFFFPIMGRGLRAMRVRLARKRRFNRRARRTQEALQAAAAEIEVRNWRIREEIELMFVANTLTDQWVHDRLVELENDPLMRSAFERINAQNLDGRNITSQPSSTFPGRRRRR